MVKRISGLVVLEISGGVWNVPDPNKEPVLTLRPWRVVECFNPITEHTGKHLSGYCLERFEGRFSTEILAVDPATRICKTDSGRFYKLEGRTGRHPDAEYLLSRTGLTVVKDVSSELFPDCED